MSILPNLLVDGPRDSSTPKRAFGEVMDLTDEEYGPYGVVRILSNPGAVQGLSDEEIKEHVSGHTHHSPM